MVLPQLREFFQVKGTTMEGFLGQRRFCRALALSPQVTRALRSCSIPTSSGIVSATRTSACHGTWAFDQLPVRRPPAIRKGHFPALPCLKQEEPNWAQPTTIRSPLTSAHPTCAVSRASSPSPSFGLQSRTRSLTCDIRRAGAEFVVEESSETVERTPSTPPSTPKRCAPAPQPMPVPSGRCPPRS